MGPPYWSLNTRSGMECVAANTERAPMKHVVLLLLCGVLAQDLLANITLFDERGNPLRETTDTPSLRRVPDGRTGSLYGISYQHLRSKEVHPVLA